MDPKSETTVDYPCSLFLYVLEGKKPPNLFGIIFQLCLPGGFGCEDVAKPGEVKKLKKGDIAHIGKGCSIKWTSQDGGKGTPSFLPFRFD
jgi:hypothetical protein